ncbi:hypothetical protein [Kitasatospora sp. NPDC056181]|uniref:hypothetical protein n=1 Tax=Kitasatospora sp. NPDC056181 TaxID=3345737 RepID=UPI0035D65C2A
MTSQMMKNIRQGGAGQQGQQQLVKAKDRDIDPADTSALTPGSDAGKASESASDKSSVDTGKAAGETTSDKTGNPAGSTTGGKDGESASASTGGNAGARAGRRLGRPRGPERAKLSVRILKENDDKLTRAVEQTGENPQDLVDQALRLLFAKLKIRDDKASKNTGENASS